MSVYTILKNKDVRRILSSYDIGTLQSFRGISEGITNTNYFINTSSGKYVLTIFEDIKKSKVTKYLKLMNFFSSDGLCSPEIMTTKTGDILTLVKNKPCSIMKKLSGKTVENTSNQLCKSLGGLIGKFHISGMKLKTNISNSRDIVWVEKTINKIKNHITSDQLKLLKHSHRIFEKLFNLDLPYGVIHSDLFRDNVLASKNKVTGIIDYYYSFNGPLIYELAVIANDWCINKDGTIHQGKFTNLISSYNSIREINKKEMKYMNNAMVAAALRFYLSRLTDMIFPKVGEITHIKDPNIFENILLKRIEQK